MNLQGTHLRTNGYSLVEVLISMTLGLILLSGALQIFVRASVTHAEMAARQRKLGERCPACCFGRAKK